MGEDDKQYKELYAKWAPRANKAAGNAAGAGNAANMTETQVHNQECFSSYASLTSGGVPGTEHGSIPPIEKADPSAPAAEVTNRIRMDSERLDNYRICARCQGLGQYKEFLDMGNGCSREIMKMCDQDLDGSPCDGGIVMKNPKKGKDLDKKEESKDTQEEDPCEEPTYRVVMVDAEEEEEEEGWLQLEVDLPQLSDASQVDAHVEHMRFFELEVPGLYYLRTELPVFVDDEDMECTFNRKTRCLTIKAPVVPPLDA